MPNAIRLNLKRIFRLNMLIGLTITVSATYMVITETYGGIVTNQSTEFLLGWTAIAGLLYTVGFWYACIFKEQFFQRSSDNHD